MAINGFTPNQELQLPLTAGNLAVQFIVRALEPGIRIDQQGTVYVDSIRGVPTGFDLHRWSPVVDPPANADGTYPFEYKGRPDGCGVLASGCDLLGVAEGGGDADMAVNFPVSATAVPNLAVTSLTLAPGITAARSGNRGDSFSSAQSGVNDQPNPVAGLIPGDDRQWMDGFGTQQVYLSYHDAGTFNIEVQRSNDGGQTYVDGVGEAIDPQTFPIAGGVPPTNTANLLGSIRVDRSNCATTRGNLYQIFVAPETAAENATGGTMRSVYVGVSTDVKLGLPVYTFSDYKIYTGPMRANYANIFPALAVDDFGYLYAVWSDNSKVFYSFSTNGGVAWAPAMAVNSDSSNLGRPNVFPWVAADGNGHVGIAWVGGDRAGDSNDPAIHAPCSTGSSTCMSGWTNWNVYYAESVNGHDANPVFMQRAISDHVIHRGTVSTGGLGGAANRNLGDFFQIAFDPQHRANPVFSDDHKVHPMPISGHPGSDDPQARRLIRANFTHQLQAEPDISTTGACAAGPPIPPSEDQGQGTDNDGDNFAFTAKSNPENGALTFGDSAQTASVRSTNGVRAIRYAGNCVSFVGDAKVNGQMGYQVSFTACDLSALGSGIGTFSISVTGPNGYSYQKRGNITKGFVKLHPR